jgi:PAS domain-containing protein
MSGSGQTSVSRNSSAVTRRPAGNDAGSAAIRAQILATLRAIAASEGSVGDVERAIGLLRSTHYAVHDFLADLAVVKDSLRASSASPAEAIKAWSRLDRFSTDVLSATAGFHEAVLERCERGFVEIDGAGRVVYANNSILRHIPDLIGREFAECFANDSAAIRRAMTENVATGIRRLSMTTIEGELPVSVEIGPIRIGDQPLRHYALLGSRRAYLDAQLAALEAAPIGAIQVDEAGRIAFINKAGENLLEVIHQEIVNAELHAVFIDKTGDLEQRLFSLLKGGNGFATELEAERPLKKPIPLRSFIMPLYIQGRQCAGALMFFRSMEIEHAREAIYRACREHRKPKTMLHEVLQIVREIVPFDEATFGLYGDGMKYFKALFVEPKPKTPWPVSWFEIPNSLVNWIKGDELWIEDIDQFLRSKPDAKDIHENQVTQDYLRSGIKSVVCVPLRQSESVATVLSLLSRTPARFGSADAERLKQLPIEHALLTATEAFAQQQRDFIRKTLRAVASARTPRDLAQTVARRLAAFFNWDHVSIFKVNRLQGRFEVIGQAGKSKTSYVLPDSYQQPLDEGLLGKTLSTGRALWIDDIRDERRPHPYKKLNPWTRSSLCLPIKLDGTISWILNIETNETHAFHGPDLEAVGSIVNGIARTLDRLFRASLTDSILNLTDQGVVIVDALGEIRHANSAALTLLGVDDPQPCALANFAGGGKESTDYKILSEELSVNERHITLRSPAGELRSVIASMKKPSDEYDHKIWLLTDVGQRNWSFEFRYLREVAHDVALQTRVPLMMISTLAEKGREIAKDQPPSDLFKRIRQLVGKTDISYERLAKSLSTREQGQRSWIRADPVRLLAAATADIPDNDKEMISTEAKQYLPPVYCDPASIEFVMRSILLYLLRLKRLDSRIRCSIASDHEGALISIGAQASAQELPGHGHKDPLSELEAAARLAAALNPDAITSVIASHNGWIRMPERQQDGDLTFRLWLPASDAEVRHA